MTGFQVSKGDFSSEQLPQTEGVAEHVSLHGVASALGEHLRSHPAQVLHKHTHTKTFKCWKLSRNDVLFGRLVLKKHCATANTHTHKMSPNYRHKHCIPARASSSSQQLPRDVTHLTPNCRPSTLCSTESAHSHKICMKAVFFFSWRVIDGRCQKKLWLEQNNSVHFSWSDLLFHGHCRWCRVFLVKEVENLVCRQVNQKEQTALTPGCLVMLSSSTDCRNLDSAEEGKYIQRSEDGDKYRICDLCLTITKESNKGRTWLETCI